MLFAERNVYWLGGVDQENYEKVLTTIVKLYKENPLEWINLLITTL